MIHINDSNHDYKQYDQSLQLMTMNLLQIKREITERDQEMNQSQIQHSLSPEEDYSASHSSKEWIIRRQYQQYLQKVKLPNNHQQKLQKLVNEESGIGNTVALFEMMYYFKDVVEEDWMIAIQNKALKGFQELDDEDSKNKQQIMSKKRCYSQLIAICGIQDKLLCEHFIEEMATERTQFGICFLVLINMGRTGLSFLIALAGKEHPQLTPKILDNLVRSPCIISSVIVPHLLSQIFQSNQPKQRDLSISILSRLHYNINSKDIAEMLKSLFWDGGIDKQLLVSCLRCMGGEGELILLEMMKYRNNYEGLGQINEDVIAMIAKVLGWRVRPRQNLRIKCIQYDLEYCFLPGKFYQYEGNVGPQDPSSQDNINISHSPDNLCFNLRDLLSMLIHQQNTLETQVLDPFEAPFKTQTKLKVNNCQLFTLFDVLDLEDQLDETPRISEEVVKTLGNELVAKGTLNDKIKEVVLLELGNIGLPQAYECHQAVIKMLWNQNSAIRTAACWTLTQITESLPKKALNRLVQLLRDSFWKVRTSACITIGLKVREPNQYVIENLIRALNDGSIGKVTVCQSLVKIGEIGEEILLDILKNSHNNDFKIREPIISSFQLINLQTPNLNSILEQIFKNSNQMDSRTEAREMCLKVLNSLRQRSKSEGINDISHLKDKNMLPFYYRFLEDGNPKIRNMASNSLLAFGCQAELIFIQGLTRGQQLVKIECIRCLFTLGVQNFRALILALRDEDVKVRKFACETIVKYKIEDIVNYFSSRQNYSISILCNLKELLGGGKIDKRMKEFVKEVIWRIEKIKNCAKDCEIFDEQIKENMMPN